MKYRISLRAIAALVTTASVGCFPETETFEGGIVSPPFVDDGSFRGRPDATAPDVAPGVYPPPWAGGSLTLPRRTLSGSVASTCGAARPVIARTTPTLNHQMCASGRYLYLGGGDIARVDLATIGTFGLDDLTGQNTAFLSGNVGCASTYVTLALESPRNAASALVEFADVMQPGLVRWSDQRMPGPADPQGVSELAVGDGLTAWLYSSGTEPGQLYVAGPHGESPRVLRTVSRAADLHADGTHLVYSDDSDIYLWTYGQTSAENLTADAPAQAWPWISGNDVIWAAAPTDASVDAGPTTMSLYAMDLTTRVTTRLDQPPRAQAMVTSQPIIVGDWVVWPDARNAASSDGGVRLELYGYNLTTGREYPIVTGDVDADAPIVVGSDVFFVCNSSFGTADLFTVPLPTP